MRHSDVLELRPRLTFLYRTSVVLFPCSLSERITTIDAYFDTILMGVRRETAKDGSGKVSWECANTVSFVTMEIPCSPEFAKGGGEGDGEK
jgi:hypothetical protein